MESRFVDLMDAPCAQALGFDSCVDRWGYDADNVRTRGASAVGRFSISLSPTEITTLAIYFASIAPLLILQPRTRK